MKFSIVLLISFIFACNKRSEIPEKSPVVIPNLEVLVSDSTLSLQQDILFFRGKSFSGFVIEKHQNGRILAKNAYFKGKLEGKQEKFYPDGSKMEVRFYVENRKNGEHNGWWENGQMKFEYFIKNDIPIETHREWYPSGQLYSLATFNAEGQPEGKQQMWFSTGQIKSNYVIVKGRRFGFLGAKGCMGENEKKTSALKFGKK